MIICMFDIICVTNRKLCCGDFFERIENIAKAKPKAVILREKDLNEDEYLDLAKQVTGICRKYSVPCILHNFPGAAAGMNAKRLHLPLDLLRQMSECQKSVFKELGTSCHSTEDALEAEKLGCTYITAGHVFVTECKKDIQPRGIAFLSDICKAVKIPVFAIGGIKPENASSVLAAGAAGICVMSGFMECRDASEFTAGFRDL